MKAKKMTNIQLRHKIKELEAQLSSTYAFANDQVKKLGEDRLMASGVLVTLHHIGGKEASMPFMIKDGLSQETIDALCKDIKKSYDLSVMFKPS